MANASVPTPAPKVQSISRRFSYAFIGVVTLILLGFAAIAIFVNIARIEARLENTVENALQLSNISLPAPLWKLDNDIVNDFIGLWRILYMAQIEHKRISKYAMVANRTRTPERVSSCSSSLYTMRPSSWSLCVAYTSASPSPNGSM